VNVSSDAHATFPFSFSRCGNLDVYNEWLGSYKEYGYSKSASILFTVELDRRFQKDGIRSNSLHPGMVYTEIGRYNWMLHYLFLLGRYFLKTIPQGAATSVLVATAPELEGIGANYFSNCQFDKPQDWANDLKTAAQLWEMSAKMVNLEEL